MIVSSSPSNTAAIWGKSNFPRYRIGFIDVGMSEFSLIRHCFFEEGAYEDKIRIMIPDILRIPSGG